MSQQGRARTDSTKEREPTEKDMASSLLQEVMQEGAAIRERQREREIQAELEKYGEPLFAPPSVHSPLPHARGVQLRPLLKSGPQKPRTPELVVTFESAGDRKGPDSALVQEILANVRAQTPDPKVFAGFNTQESKDDSAFMQEKS
jgi:hypothetical protein